MQISIGSEVQKIMSEGEVVLYSTQWSRLSLIGWNILAMSIFLMGLIFLANVGTHAAGMWSVVIAQIVSLGTILQWQKQFVVVTDNRLVYLDGTSAKSIPLNKIEHVKQSRGSLIVRAGTVFNTMNLKVPDAAALGEALERARMNPKLARLTAEPMDKSTENTAKTGNRRPLTPLDIVIFATIIFDIVVWRFL